MGWHAWRTFANAARPGNQSCQRHGQLCLLQKAQTQGRSEQPMQTALAIANNRKCMFQKVHKSLLEVENGDSGKLRELSKEKGKVIFPRKAQAKALKTIYPGFLPRRA